MSSTRTQRIIAFIILISPWIYLPTAIKEIIFLALAVILYLSTVPLHKKSKGDFETETHSQSTHTHSHPDISRVAPTVA